VPDWFSRERQAAVALHQQRPVYLGLRFAQQLVRQNQEKKIRASIPDERFELRSITQTVLQCHELSRYTSITAVINCIKIVRFPFGKQRVTAAQCRIMDAEIFLQDLPSLVNRFKSHATDDGQIIIFSQIRPRLFAFEDHGATNSFLLRSIGGNIHAVTTTRQFHLDRTRRIAVRLRPKHGQSFQVGVRCCFTASDGCRYSLIHSASSFAQ